MKHALLVVILFLLVVPKLVSSETVSIAEVLVIEATAKKKVEALHTVQDKPVSDAWTKDRILDLIDKEALEHGVSASVMKAVIACESGYNIDIQSRHFKKDGTRERSFGLVQLNLDYNPQYTYAQAIDPEFAINLLAEWLKAGKGSRWSCYRNM